MMDYFSWKKQAYMLAFSCQLVIITEKQKKILVDKLMTEVFSSDSWKDITCFLKGYALNMKGTKHAKQ